jgi:Fur family ferric uptake transcriptional regulator
MSHDITTIANQLRQAGYRVTPQRQMILDAVCELGGHVTPEEMVTHVQKIAPAINQATVYRTLHFLSEQQIITVTQLVDGRIGYELAGEEPHHHLVCRQCKGTIEIPHTVLRQLFSQTDQEYDFAIDMNHISFFGLCAYCRTDSEPV